VSGVVGSAGTGVGAAGAGVDAGVSAVLPHATTPRTSVSTTNTAAIFFIFKSPFLFYFSFLYFRIRNSHVLGIFLRFVESKNNSGLQIGMVYVIMLLI
jgi:hypothetical protein